MIRAYLVLLALFAMSDSAWALCDAARTRVVGPYAEVREVTSPQMLEPLKRVVEKAGIDMPTVCEYERGVIPMPHVVLPNRLPGVYRAVIFIPHEISSTLSDSELLGMYAHEVGHVVRQHVVVTQGTRNSEEKAVDQLASSWVGERSVADALRAMMRFGYQKGILLLIVDRKDVQRVVDLELQIAMRKKRYVCESEFTTQSRMCRGGEGRDDDECFMRIKRAKQQCLAPTSEMAQN